MKRGVIVDAVLFMLSICDGNGKDDDGSRTIAIVPPALASAIIVHFRFWLLFGAGGETVAGDGKTTFASSTIPHTVLHTESTVEHKALIST